MNTENKSAVSNYSQPKLKVYGDVREITRGTGGGDADKAGTGKTG